MAIRFVTFLLWLAAAATAVAWALPWVRPSAAPDGAAPVAVALEDVVPPADWGPLLTRDQGASAADTAAMAGAADAAGFKLVGVAGPLAPNGRGVALLSVDGKPAQAYREGESIDGQRVVQQVVAHTVRIGMPGGPPALTLQAPLLPPPASAAPAR